MNNALKKLSIIALTAATFGAAATLASSADAQSVRGSDYYSYAQPQPGYMAYPAQNYGYTTQSRLGSGTEFHTSGQPGYNEYGMGGSLFGF